MGISNSAYKPLPMNAGNSRNAHTNSIIKLRWRINTPESSVFLDNMPIFVIAQNKGFLCQGKSFYQGSGGRCRVSGAAQFSGLSANCSGFLGI